jgi:general secretion pathway protein C
MSQPGSAQRRVATGLAIGAFVLAAAALVVAITRRGGGTDEARVPAPAPAKPVAADYIRRLDDKHAVMSRATADKLLANKADLATEVRQVDRGFVIVAIPAGSPLAQLGFHDGDVIRGVNGMDVSTPESAVGIYTQLKSTTQFTIDLDRAGESMQLTIDIR